MAVSEIKCTLFLGTLLSRMCMHEQGVMRSGLVSIYIYICMYMTKKSLNDSLAVDSPFQTIAIDFLSNL